MSVRRILTKQMERSNGTARVVKVPSNRRPSAESLSKLEREIAAQISANEVMRSKSMERAAQISKY